MPQDQFEKHLSRKMLKRRLIEGAFVLVFLALSIVCYHLREASKEVIYHEGFYFIPGWDEVNYNDSYIPFIVLGLIVATMAGSFLLADLISCRFATVQKDLYRITVYRGMLHNSVYVDGVEKGRMEPFSFSHVVEVWLANRIRVTVSFSRTVWYIAHISFSDQTASVEV